VPMAPEAAGLSATTIIQPIRIWQEGYRDWTRRPLEVKDHVHTWLHGVPFNLRPDKDRLACPVVIRVLMDGTKEATALKDGHRES